MDYWILVIIMNNIRSLAKSTRLNWAASRMSLVERPARNLCCCVQNPTAWLLLTQKNLTRKRAKECQRERLNYLLIKISEMCFSIKKKCPPIADACSQLSMLFTMLNNRRLRYLMLMIKELGIQTTLVYLMGIVVMNGSKRNLHLTLSVIVMMMMMMMMMMNRQ